MNLYEKVQKMRCELQDMKLKKSGENKFAGYKYYELGDILPPINKLMLADKCVGLVTFDSENARLTIVNCEAPEEMIVFTSPMASASLKGAHDIQNLGAVETYQRRYLYMTAFEIVENDFFDATQGMTTQPKPKKEKKMSEDMIAKLNEAVVAYSSLTGKLTKEVMAEIKNNTGKVPAQMDDADGERVLAYLHSASYKYIDELGA